jgi:hypothetical protein
METIEFKNYSLRDGIKIKKMINETIKRNSNLTIEQCFSQLLVKKTISSDYILLLLFNFKYSGIIHIYHPSNGVLTIQQNEKTGKFYTNNNMRVNKTNNEFFIYLGTFKTQDFLESVTYDVLYDFVLYSSGLIYDLNMDKNYCEISIPEKILEMQMVFGKNNNLSYPLFEDLISGKIGDIKINCIDGHLFGSKYLLANCSEYFRNYLSFQHKNCLSTDLIEIPFSTELIKFYILYCVTGKIDKNDIQTELIMVAKYFLHDQFLTYLYQELVIKIDRSEIQSSEKIELYENLLTYFET